MTNTADVATWNKLLTLKYQMETSFINQEIHWIQRAKQSWSLLGDRNKKYFQTMTTTRKQKNTIRTKVIYLRLLLRNLRRDLRQITPSS